MESTIFFIFFFTVRTVNLLTNADDFRPLSNQDVQNMHMKASFEINYFYTTLRLTMSRLAMYYFESAPHATSNTILQLRDLQTRAHCLIEELMVPQKYKICPKANKASTARLDV